MLLARIKDLFGILGSMHIFEKYKYPASLLSILPNKKAWMTGEANTIPTQKSW
jgi:hypothetical protein